MKTKGVLRMRNYGILFQFLSVYLEKVTFSEYYGLLHCEMQNKITCKKSILIESENSCNRTFLLTQKVSLAPLFSGPPSIIPSSRQPLFCFLSL